MLYTIRNISKNNIVSGKTILYPNSEIKTHDLVPFQKMLENGYLIIINNNENDIRANNITGILSDDIIDCNNNGNLNNEQRSIDIQEISNTPLIESKINHVETTVNITENQVKIPVYDNFIDDTIKQELMEAFFSFYINQKLSNKELKIIKWFYKNVGITNKVDPDILQLLDEAEDYEDLAVTLLNSVYPKLLDIYLTEK